MNESSKRSSYTSIQATIIPAHSKTARINRCPEAFASSEMASHAEWVMAPCVWQLDPVCPATRASRRNWPHVYTPGATKLTARRDET